MAASSSGQCLPRSSPLSHPPSLPDSYPSSAEASFFFFTAASRRSRGLGAAAGYHTFAMSILLSGIFPRDLPLLRRSHDRRVPSIHRRVVFPVRYGPVGLGIRNTGAKTPAAVDTSAPMPPVNATSLQMTGCTSTPAPARYSTAVHATVDMYAG